ncbi:MAG: hypothetical protein JJT75_02575 [Opitutales bacterium]|nr:hypothetical protein [Opitutales bacterium]MCH8541358.1 hypothetical protein [Opitutales bacterium]
MKFRLLPIVVILALAFIFLGALYLLLNQADELVSDPKWPGQEDSEPAEFPVEFFLANPESLDEGYYILEARFAEELLEDEVARVILTHTPGGEALPLVVPIEHSNPPEAFTSLKVEWDGAILILRDFDSAE